jgi:hypothetical protein
MGASVTFANAVTVFSGAVAQFAGGAAFGGAARGIGGGGGIIGNLSAPPGGVFTAAEAHSGGIIGGSGVYRSVSPAAFMSAPRFHLGSDEVPAILQRGERVVPRGGGGNPPAVVNVHVNNQAGVDVQQQTSRNRSGGADVRVMIRNAVASDLAGGAFDSILSSRHGIKPQSARR